jgi:hypothetical protein
VTCGGDFNTPVVNNNDLNKGQGVLAGLRDANGNGVDRAQLTADANVKSKGDYNEVVHDSVDADSSKSDLKLYIGGRSNGSKGTPQSSSIDGVIAAHWHNHAVSLGAVAGWAAYYQEL